MPPMKNTRREFVKKLGVAAAVSAALPLRGGAPAARAADAAPDTARSGGVNAKPIAGALCVLSFARGGAGGSETHVGALASNDADHIVDLGAVAKRVGMKPSFDPAQMLSFIAAGDRALVETRELLAKAKPEDGLAMKDARLLAPIPVPARNVYAVGWNYLEHFKEGEGLRNASTTPKELPEHPVFFTKGSHTVNEPFGTCS